MRQLFNSLAITVCLLAAPVLAADSQVAESIVPAAEGASYVDAAASGAGPGEWEAEADAPLGPELELLNPALDVAAEANEPPGGPTFGYNTTQSSTTWVPGNNDRFGIVSLESFASLGLGEVGGVVTGLGFHFLDGPVRTDMPPRLFDFTIGY